MRVTCSICPQSCELEEGQIGFCRARSARDGVVMSDNYGLITAMALDPIEKKPLRRFHPGSTILSVGSFGCNLRCPFCQNHEISMCSRDRARTAFVSPEELVEKALAQKPSRNIGIAYTYNEPLVGYEYVRDCAAAAHEHGLKNVLVTNGYVNEEPLRALLPYIDAMNIDLKAFTEDFYRTLHGHIEPVKRTISIAAKACHVEVTTLIIPGRNDSEDEMRSLSEWLSGISTDIPLHISRYFPRYRMADGAATPVETIRALAVIARERLKYVYTGNC
jgi:pyruvate formate lyase activating enzyme